MTEEETDKKFEALQQMLKLGQYADEFDFDKTEIEAEIKGEPENVSIIDTGKETNCFKQHKNRQNK
ncbi:Transcriptional regulator [Caenorhabditis elegans]|uniref:Transcriptional regulator n=1 Tax=Caenorhabditis elegans TaxID=6239 RepID=Q9XV11_CAEEL|nr:Transcriptional regulator [Caenorhabditis elegans]CAB04410.1 Transcriptional regulator [Caenorhabditis elegans]|eukprot:NP_001256920.1 Uncharacterized protein CELE_F48F5.6 [Caenorhabditis elegans]